MSSETNNAPREVWVTLTDRGEPIQVWATENAARHPVLRQRVERYVHPDLVVPTVQEIADAVCNGMHGVGRLYDETTELERVAIDNATRGIRRLLLSHIEGAGGW